MGSWIHTVPLSKKLNNDGRGGGTPAVSGNVRRERTATFLTLRAPTTAPFFPNDPPKIDSAEEKPNDKPVKSPMTRVGHSQSFLYARPSLTEARRNTITQKLFLAKDIKAKNTATSPSNNTTTPPSNNTTLITNPTPIFSPPFSPRNNLPADNKVDNNSCIYKEPNIINTPIGNSTKSNPIDIDQINVGKVASNVDFSANDPKNNLAHAPSNSSSSSITDISTSLSDLSTDISTSPSSDSDSTSTSACSSPTLTSFSAPSTAAIAALTDILSEKTSSNSNSFLSLNKSISCDQINNKDWSLIDSVNMHRSASINLSPSGPVSLSPYPPPPSLPISLPSTPRGLSKSMSSSSIGSCDSDGCGDETGQYPHISIFDDYGECDCNLNNSNSSIPPPGGASLHAHHCNSIKNTCNSINNNNIGNGKDSSYALYTSEMESGKMTCVTPRSGCDENNSSNNNYVGIAADIFKCEGNCMEGGEDVVLFAVEGVTKLKGGSLDRLVQRLTCDKHNDPEYTASFILMHRIFSDSTKIFSLLRRRYLSTTNNMVRLRVCGVLKHWLERHYADFLQTSDEEKSEEKSETGGEDEGDEEEGCTLLLSRLSRFLEVVKQEYPTSAAQLKKLVERNGSMRSTTLSINPPPPIRPRPKWKGFLDFDDLEVARQLTLMEFEWFKQIQPTECLNQAWIRSRSEAPNICAMIVRSNRIPFWVATEIIRRDNPEERVAILKKFVTIADHCRTLCNYNAVMEILSGLNMTAVYRLKKTWAALSPRVLNVFLSLNQLMSPDSNFKVYRDVLRKETQPRVPYLGRYLTDLVFVEDAMPLFLPNGLVHFWKCRSIAQIILDLTSHQKQPYVFEVVPEIQSYLQQQGKGLTENALLKMSRKLEPKHHRN